MAASDYLEIESIVDRLADPSEQMAEAVGMALARRAAGLYDSEPGRAAWVQQLGALFLERAALLRTLEWEAGETGSMVGDDE